MATVGSVDHPETSDRESLFACLFDPGLFKNNALLAVDQLEKYLSDSSSSLRGLALTDPQVLLQQARALTAGPAGPGMEAHKLAAIIALYVSTGIQLYSPGSMGRQFSGALPLAGVVDLASAIANQPSSFYEAGQLPNVAERVMAEELNRFIGWPPDRFAMATTSGGSLANLTAILAARNDRLPDAWAKGLTAGGTRPAVAVSEDAHYSIRRAAGILGIGEEQIVRLPINAAGQIEAAKVRPALDAAARRGLDVFCLAAAAGTTSLGAFDPLEDLADIARERGLWLHVDGAHGASLLVSHRLRHKLHGIEAADSFIWDAHKLMFMPPACTLLFYRHKEKARAAFRQEASYVFEKSADIYTEFDGAEKNLECTKRPMIMNLWVAWALYGRAVFAEKIEYLCRLTGQAHAILEEAADFAALHRPESNILCFRHLPGGLPPGQVGDFQTEVRNRVRERGRFFLSKVDIGGVPALRTVFMNHAIAADHFRMLLDEIRTVGRDILDETSHHRNREEKPWAANA